MGAQGFLDWAYRLLKWIVILAAFWTVNMIVFAFIPEGHPGPGYVILALAAAGILWGAVKLWKRWRR